MGKERDCPGTCEALVRLHTLQDVQQTWNERQEVQNRDFWSKLNGFEEKLGKLKSQLMWITGAAATAGTLLGQMLFGG